MLPVYILGQTNPPYFNIFHLLFINQLHNMQITNKIHYNVYDVFYSQVSHQHVSAAISAIFRVILLLLLL
jgi:hypothetical protein